MVGAEVGGDFSEPLKSPTDLVQAVVSLPEAMGALCCHLARPALPGQQRSRLLQVCTVNLALADLHPLDADQGPCSAIRKALLGISLALPPRCSLYSTFLP